MRSNPGNQFEIRKSHRFLRIVLAFRFGSHKGFKYKIMELASFCIVNSKDSFEDTILETSEDVFIPGSS